MAASMAHRFLEVRRCCRYARTSLVPSARRLNSQSWFNESRAAETYVEIDNRAMKFSCGKLARFADGSAVVQLGNTAVLATAVSKNISPENTFLPLTVDYRHKGAAAGRIPTNHLRRELGPTEQEILTSRVIDRSLRPLFPEGFLAETQIICNLMSVDGVNDPDVLSINAASAALALSDIPWNGPVGAVKVGLVDTEPLLNPTRKQLSQSVLSLIVSTTNTGLVVMLEGHADCIELSLLKKSLKVGAKGAQTIARHIQSMADKSGKKKNHKRRSTDGIQSHVPEKIQEAASTLSRKELMQIFTDRTHDKISRDEAVNKVRQGTMETLKRLYCEEHSSTLLQAFDEVVRQVFRELPLRSDRRCDGRTMTELREIRCQTNLYEPLHGSALFQRGQTQVMCTVTFDSIESAAKADPISEITGGLKEKNFMLHYEFPPYATNEVGKLMSKGRRELGHGALAEKAIRPVVPDNHPFTIRLTSEVLESNGSSSMATVCGGSLALMDAGVDLKEAVAGVAVGLVTQYSDSDPTEIQNYTLLTDILGIEDYLGDMDFKIAGTKKAITALQLDVKVPGLPLKIIMEAIDRANVGKREIIGIMNNCLARPREDKKDSGPVTERFFVPAVKRPQFVGLGGYNLKKMTTDFGITVTPIDESNFQIFAPNKTAFDEAMERIKEIMEQQNEPVLEFGAIYTATITELRDIGVLVQIHPQLNPVMLHNSQLDRRKVSHASALGLKVGQEISVKYFGRDPASGKIRLSRKVLYSPASTVTKNLNYKQTEVSQTVDTGS